MTSAETQTEYDTSNFAMMLSSATVFPMVLKATIELGLLEIIEKAHPNAISPSEIASSLQTKNPGAPPMLDRMLRLLASYGVVSCSIRNESNCDQVTRLYTLQPLAYYFIPNREGGSLAPMVQAIHDKVMIDMWHNLKDAVMEGGLPFTNTYGMSSTEYVMKDERYMKIFMSSMIDCNTLFIKRILHIYKGFEGLNSLLDVGGGDGSILNMIVSKYPGIKGINFDLAHVVGNAHPYPGIENFAGDMFVDIPKSEAIFMKWILHSWDDENCLKILKNCYKSIPDQGKVMVVEFVAPEVPNTDIATRSELQLDLFMMNMNPNGKERTKQEFTDLAKAAGFAAVEVACTAYNFSVIEFHKN
ncbi:caffeic acid 3-O-methyltransferase-like [Impatiens glandulifera]|uniref:caffeic acid 3-O-methyltransferase-like n=1 Tax=Impatiens glandulifera TaxID=253017 RepID=UPI001FB13FED|nr:caffeic acid 3-O-methyltransferase-like [Impatiens glandulifera]